MILETQTLIDAVKKMYPVYLFFKDRYFPDGKTFASEKALIEMKKKGKDIAPFVIPVRGGIIMTSEGYRAMEVKGPYIAPGKVITTEDLEKKAFGESPESGRTPEDRENEVEAEHMDDLRHAVERRKEKMCTDLVTTGRVMMEHYATANDAAKGKNATKMVLQFYDDNEGFQNYYKMKKPFSSMSGEEKMRMIYDMATELNRRGVKATDLVMTRDVGPDFFLDKDVLEYFDIRKVDLGSVAPKELPDGVMSPGTYNVSGVALTLFVYDNSFTDLDGKEKDFLPAGTIAMLKPGMGKTVYAQVTFVNRDTGFETYVDPMVPRVIYDENNNLAKVLVVSRPVPYPNDPEGWLVTNIYDPVSESDTEQTEDQAKGFTGQDDNVSDSDTDGLLSEEDIRAMTKSQLLEYGASIGMEGLTDKMLVDDIRNAILDYQMELAADQGGN